MTVLVRHGADDRWISWFLVVLRFLILPGRPSDVPEYVLKGRHCCLGPPSLDPKVSEKPKASDPTRGTPF